MADAELINLVLLPLGLGLLGFVEPCSIGSSRICCVEWGAGSG